MKHLRKYNEEFIFDSSTIEDILIDITDEGHTWDILIGKKSNGSSNISIYINVCEDINWDMITPCVLRVSKYLSQEGYTPSGSTGEIISAVEDNHFSPDGYVAGYSDWLFYMKRRSSGELVRTHIDPVTLELQFKK